jgi:hypothetical protein
MIYFIYLFAIPDDGPQTETCSVTRQIELIDKTYVLQSILLNHNYSIS